MKKRGIIVVFLVAQFIGITCWWAWHYAPSSVGVPMWGASLVLLFPGNILGGWFIEQVFWRTSLSLLNMSILTTILQFVINGALWLGVIKTFKMLIAYFSPRSG
jgi:hypothetical protein